MGFAVHVPHYLAQSPYPQASITALEHVQRASGLELEVAALTEAAEETRLEVDRQVSESAEVAQVVHSLEEQYDAFRHNIGRPSLLAETAEIPTADELGAEFERFLAEQSGDEKGI
jgi:folate-binding Fe-S cluster repair protein YgfZ